VLSKEDLDMLELNNKMADAAMKEQKKNQRKKWWSDHGIDVVIASITLIGVIVTAIVTVA